MREFHKQHRFACLSTDASSGFLGTNQLMQRLAISQNGVLALVRLGLLNPNQVAPLAPWRIPSESLVSPAIKGAVEQLAARGDWTSDEGGCPDRQRGLFAVTTRLTSKVMKGAL